MRSIVVGTDGSASADAALGQAAELAKATGATLHIVTAYPDVATFRETYASSAKAEPVDLRQVAENVLARKARPLQDDGVNVEEHAQEGDAAEVILNVADEVDADLIVLGARGLSAVQRFLLGSVSSKVSQHASTSVMVVRGH